MPTPWFGWGVPLLKRHWSLRWGECPHCGKAEFRPSYDASKMVVLMGVPVLPLGKVHIHEECAACGDSSNYVLADWEAQREEHLVTALEELAKHREDPVIAGRAMEAMSHYGDADEFAALATQIEPTLGQNPESLGQLGWCMGHFARFEDATRLYGKALTLQDRPDRRAAVAAYQSLPDSPPPRRPNAFFQGLRFLLLPLLILAGLTVYVSHLFKQRVTEVHLLSGIGVPYEVQVNDQTVPLPPYGHEQITLAPGLIRVAPASPEAFDFPPFQFELTAKRGTRPTTAVINPDKAAVISWEELVYQIDDETESQEPNADQFALHAGDPFYLFHGITDHFADPPKTLEIHSEDSETYRYVIHHQGDEPPVSLCSLLLEQGEMELAREFCRNVLMLDPGETGLLPFLHELSPTKETLSFLETRLKDRPLRLDWHRHYVDLGNALKQEASLQARYAAMVEEEPSSGVLHFLLGLSKGADETAYEHFHQAALLGSADALYRISVREAAAGEFDSALDKVGKATRAQPEKAAFQAHEEDLMVALQQYDGLIPRYRERLDTDPLDQGAAMILAGLYEVMGRPEQAQTITDHFIQAVALDGSLLSEETAPYRQLFASVRAQWAGNAERFIESGPGFGDVGGLNRHLLKKDYEAASAEIDRAATDPFVHLLIYALTTQRDVQPTLAQVQLSQALRLLEDDPLLGPTVASWFRSGAQAPSLEETQRVRLPNHQRRILLFALAQRHPEASAVYLPMAKRLNYSRIFPYLILKEALGE